VIAANNTYLLVIAPLEIPLVLLQLSDLFSELVGDVDPLCCLEFPTRLLRVELVESRLSGFERCRQAFILANELGYRLVFVLNLEKQLCMLCQKVKGPITGQFVYLLVLGGFLTNRLRQQVFRVAILRRGEG